MKEVVTILGGGAFGTAIATILADNEVFVNLWCHEKEVVQDISENRTNSLYLPNVKLHENIRATNDLKEALHDSMYVFEAVPLKFLRRVLIDAKGFIEDDQSFVVLSKGIEQETLFFPSQIIESIFKNNKIAVLSGPNFAYELANKCPSAAVVACNDKKLARDLSKLLTNSNFSTYFSDDLIGVQIGGAIKNVLTLLIGMANGAKFCKNTIAFLLTNGFAEMSELALALKADQKTIYGLSGFGDLVLCSTGELSRNLQAGNLLGQGKSLDDLQKKWGVLPEGINTTKSIYDIIEKFNLDLPILTAVYDIIFKNLSLKLFFQGYMNTSLLNSF